ncbi:hypothetical protein D3C81_1780620 [compost metagenome]
MAFSRPAIASAPLLLKPIRLISASSGSRRNRRGLSLPGWPFGVTVPTSIKPKPMDENPPTASAFLSRPAASPTGVGKCRPNRSTARSAVSGTPYISRIAALPPGTRSDLFSPPMTRWCAFSGSILKKIGLPKCRYSTVLAPSRDHSISPPTPRFC